MADVAPTPSRPDDVDVAPLRWRKVEAGTYESLDGQWRVVNPWRLDTSLRHRWIVQMHADDGWFALDDDYATMRDARVAAEYEARP